jgi:hypothetical protein
MAVTFLTNEDKNELQKAINEKTFPVATPDVLGGVKPVEKTEAMTQEIGVDEDGKLFTVPSSGVGGMSTEQINTLNEMFKKCAYIGDVSAEYTAFKQAFGITDTDEEEPDTPVTPPEEPDIPVTGVSNETMWANGVDYSFESIPNEYSDRNRGEILTYNSWERTPYLYCEGASVLRITALVNTSGLNNGNQDNCFYDSEKNFVSAFSFNGKIGESEPGTYTDIVIPDNAAYVIVSGVVGNLSVPRIKLTPYE